MPAMSARRRARDERGAILPSPVVMLSIVAVVMAAIAFVVTRDDAPEERDVTAVAEDPSASATQSPESKEPEKPKKKAKPPVMRGEIYVEVYNNSSIGGLAAQVSGQASAVGWNVVGTDNWVGTIPANTVYFPERLKREAEKLALDLGIERTYPAVSPMKLDRLTVILVQQPA